MSSQIENIISACATCTTHQKCNSKEPLLPHSVTDRPWEKVGADIFEIQKKQFLVLVDYYSGYVEVDQLTSMTANQVIAQCKSQFSRHRIPDVLITQGRRNWVGRVGKCLPNFTGKDTEKLKIEWWKAPALWSNLLVIIRGHRSYIPRRSS